jgi:hypothetical protein
VVVITGNDSLPETADLRRQKAVWSTKPRGQILFPNDPNSEMALAKHLRWDNRVGMPIQWTFKILSHGIR